MGTSSLSAVPVTILNTPTQIPLKTSVLQSTLLNIGTVPIHVSQDPNVQSNVFTLLPGDEIIWPNGSVSAMTDQAAGELYVMDGPGSYTQYKSSMDTIFEVNNVPLEQGQTLWAATYTITIPKNYQGLHFRLAPILQADFLPSWIGTAMLSIVNLVTGMQMALPKFNVALDLSGKYDAFVPGSFLTGDKVQIDIGITPNSGYIPNLSSFTVCGVNEPQTPDAPLSTSPVGGQFNTSVNIANGSVTLIGPPPTGYAIRLHSLILNVANPVYVRETSAIRAYLATPGTMMMNGQICNTALSVQGTASGGTVYASYDIIPFTQDNLV